MKVIFKESGSEAAKMNSHDPMFQCKPRERREGVEKEWAKT